jgi:hypothetical protein
MTRPLCTVCNQRPRAIAYHRDEKTQYRRLCDRCIRKNKRIPAPVPRWQQAGYKKKTTCDRCGFKSLWAGQLIVYHIDGNLHNSDHRNLRTVCLNCTVDIAKSDLPWRPGDLSADA